MLTNSLIAGALGAAFLTIIVVQLNPGVPLASVDTVAVVRDARVVLRPDHRRRVLSDNRRPRILRDERDVTGVGERPRAGMAVGGALRGGGCADVAQRPGVFAGARRRSRAAHDRWCIGHQRLGARAVDDRRPALFIRAPWQPGRGIAVCDRGRRFAGLAACRARCRRRVPARRRLHGGRSLSRSRVPRKALG